MVLPDPTEFESRTCRECGHVSGLRRVGWLDRWGWLGCLCPVCRFVGGHG